MSGLVRYPCPLGADRPMADLYLPSDLTLADVQRVIRYVQTLAPDPDDLPSDREMASAYTRVSRVAGGSR